MPYAPLRDRVVGQPTAGVQRTRLPTCRVMRPAGYHNSARLLSVLVMSSRCSNWSHRVAHNKRMQRARDRDKGVLCLLHRRVADARR